MKLWHNYALILALMLATLGMFKAISTLSKPNPAQAVCAKTTDKELIPMCWELEEG